LNFDVTIKEACEGLWGCLSPTDYIQIISVIIAMLAAIASFLAVYYTKKQFKEVSDDRRAKYKPYFKIKALNGVNGSSSKSWFDIINEGFPFYVINKVEWRGNEGVIISDFFKGQTERNKTKNNEVVAVEKYESLAIIIEINESVSQEGYILVEGVDIEQNSFVFMTPVIEIKNGEIINSSKVTYQYLR
jgi:hypothetical protein